jgi:hypothetical protein
VSSPGSAACLGGLLLPGCGDASPVPVRVAVGGVLLGAGIEDLACGRCVADGGFVVETEDRCHVQRVGWSSSTPVMHTELLSQLADHGLRVRLAVQAHGRLP